MLGDHIRALKGGKWLHGIDLGDQRVLHLAEQPGLAPADRLRRVYKPDFTAGATAVELVVHRERTYPARAVVARAWSRYMDPSVVAMFRDSEQFAAWCKIGRAPEVAPAAQAPAARTTVKAAAKAAAKPEARAATAAPPAPTRARKGDAATPKAAAPAPAKPRTAARKATRAKSAPKSKPPTKAGPAARKALPKRKAAARAPARQAPPRKAAARKPARKKGRR